ncbi:MAG: hypothetical protein N3E45_10690 [Oscillatoriaceae bacterium SKW80]|nr:hypothetical protein [Oscillatoriaceae bacterium SKYG93]MCX8121280.1 hypothetical protein [Oscillatoriaceae bacterium SKW80]MDW8453386.1 hypothetical protein [Oscillatoriaceae cyanobacterium SKYGB_i_bin93]HIK26741.1 hypothetical protein [Oscillatoriaceae cyanobacterium M7585_C2015_266]
MKKNKEIPVADAPKAEEANAAKNSKNGSIELYQRAPLPENRPIASDNLEIREIIAIAGNRPISASHLQVRETISVAGIRPIFASNLQIRDTISVSGNRPIFASTLKIQQMLPGNRPVASNDIDDPESLMGFLD